MAATDAGKCDVAAGRFPQAGDEIGGQKTWKFDGTLNPDGIVKVAEAEGIQVSDSEIEEELGRIERELH